jgi:hypothetical protein
MKRILILVMVLGLVFGSIATANTKKKKKKPVAPATPYVRVVEGTYDTPAPGVGGIATLNGQGGMIEFPTLVNEAFVTVEVVDSSGQKTYFGLSNEDTDGDGQGEIVAGGCGATTEPLAIKGGLLHQVTVTMGPGKADPSCAGVATSGTIKVTLTEVP